ncbi:MAG: hypothetical protein ACM3ML_28830 [Micromonosporaceae bacterium]
MSAAARRAAEATMVARAKAGQRTFERGWAIMAALLVTIRRI